MMATVWSLKRWLVNVREALRERSRTAKGDDVVVGDFRIDLSTRSVTVRGRELPLNPAEFEVLVYLANHPKRLVTPRAMLATRRTLQKVQQTEFLRALVSLGKKLRAQEGSTQHYLRTEPWIFYSFDPGPVTNVP